MGRLKRYKKIKACDPFAPKRSEPVQTGRKRKPTDYDLPPEDSDSESQRKKRRKQELMWERDALRDDEYMEMLEAGAKKKKERKLEIQPRLPNESLKAFKYRIRTETQAALRDSFVANSTTKNRRREYMKQRKKMKKAKKAGQAVLDEDGVVEDEDGEEGEEHWRKRRREKAASDSSPHKSQALSSFGSTNDAPPDLRAFKKPQSKKDKKPQAEAAAARRRADDSVREEALRAYRALKKAREKKNMV